MRILVVAPNWIGDALMAQPLLRRLRRKTPAPRIDVVAPAWVAPLVRRMPEVDEVIEVPVRHGAFDLGARWRLGRELRRRGYDQAIVLPNTWKSALPAFLAGIPLRTGYTGEARYGLLNLRYKKSEAPMREHYAALADAPGRFRKDIPHTRLLSDEAQVKSTLRRFGIGGGYAVFCPGAEYGPAKRWPYFAQLAGKLPMPVVIVGSKQDLAAAAGIEGKNLAGRTTLDEAIDVIAGSRVVVSNDSGLMHVAAALGRPLVALFGSSSPSHTPPQPGASRVIWLGIECSPCFQRTCPLGHFRCMREIDVDNVLKAIQNLAPE
ncbi:MAG: lipopolysaccharide heptosyltransferase II [Betaproteobacteria bacterium]